MTAPAPGRWADLGPRLLSAVVMIGVGLFAIWQGGMWFRALAAGVAGLMIWELVRMRAPARRGMAIAVGAMACGAVALCPQVEWPGQIGLVLAPSALAGLAALPNWRIGVAYALVIVLGSDTLVAVRNALGFGWLVWVVAVVIASDVLGYFAGKALGGPKFWPRISPKKTWSGTIAGWVGAGLIGVVFGLGSDAMAAVVAVSLVMALAAQMGDIAESAIKRRSGVKDSSALIPGHGGVLDRFDGLLGASLALLAVAALSGFPQGLV
jgi:phosphatidate cytidylyltransferase